MPRGTNIEVRGHRDGRSSSRWRAVTERVVGQVVIEVITDSQTELAIDHTFSEASAETRTTQKAPVLGEAGQVRQLHQIKLTQ